MEVKVCVCVCVHVLQTIIHTHREVEYVDSSKCYKLYTHT